MKKQNPNKLAFNKAVVTELNAQQLRNVNGGTGVKDDGDTNSGCICGPVITKLTIIKADLL